MQRDNLISHDTPLTFLDLMELLNQWMDPVRQLQEVIAQTKDPKALEQAKSRLLLAKKTLANKCHAVSREAWLQLDNLDSTATTTHDDQGRLIKDLPASHKKYVTVFSNLTDLVQLDILSKHTQTGRVQAYNAWAGVMKILHYENNYFATKAILAALSNRLLQFSSNLQADLPKSLMEFIEELENKKYGEASYDMPCYKNHIAQSEFFVPLFAVYKQSMAALDAKASVVQSNEPDQIKKNLVQELAAIKSKLNDAPADKKLSSSEQVLFNRPLVSKDDLEKVLGLARLRDFQDTLAKLHLSLVKLKDHYNNKRVKLAMVLDIANFITGLRTHLATFAYDAKSISDLKLKIEDSFNKLNEKRFFPLFVFKEDKEGLFGKRKFQNKLPNLFKDTLAICSKLKNCLANLNDFEIQDSTKDCVLKPIKRGSKVMPRTNSSLALTGSFGGVASTPATTTATLRPSKGNKN